MIPCATRLKSAAVILCAAAALVACGGGGGSGSGGQGGGGGFVPTPGATAAPTPGATATPTVAPTATPTVAPTATPSVAPATIIGKVVDAGSGSPIAGITVAAEAALAANNAGMAGSSAPVGALTAVTAADGTFTITNTIAAPNQTNIYVDVYGGAPYANNSIHGQFYPGGHFGAGGGAMSATGVSNLGTLRLTNPNAEEVTMLAHLNTFRIAPGPGNEYGNTGATYPQYGIPGSNVLFDENLLETAAYWAGEMHTAHAIGHFCSSLGNPSGCIEHKAYLQSLPGAFAGASSAQNVAVGYLSWIAAGSPSPNTSSASTAFEQEGGNQYSASECTTPYNVATCASGDPPNGAGHFQNIMAPTIKWVGFGEIESGYQTYAQQFQ